MKSFNNNTNFNYNSQTQARRNFNPSNKVETQLLPNEVRVSSKGNFNTYVKSILTTMESGYKNCKIVARGTASEIAWNIYQFILRKAPQYLY